LYTLLQELRELAKTADESMEYAEEAMEVAVEEIDLIPAEITTLSGEIEKITAENEEAEEIFELAHNYQHTPLQREDFTKSENAATAVKIIDRLVQER